MRGRGARAVHSAAVTPARLHLLQNCLHEWAIDLAQRDAEEKRSIKGKIATRAHKQTKDYMRPFFRLCRHRVRAAVGSPPSFA